MSKQSAVTSIHCSIITNYRFAKPVGVACNTLNKRMVYRNFHAKFGIFGFYNSPDLGVQTDSIDS